MTKREREIRGEERMRCAKIVRDYGRWEPDGIGPVHAAAEALELSARLLLVRDPDEDMVVTSLEQAPEEEAA